MSAYSASSMAHQRVLLLNPPGERVYIRDYFCSKTTKSNYLFHPIDLVVLSGIVGSRHEVRVLDAMAERLDVARSLERVRSLAPDVVIALVGSVSWSEDREFLAAVAANGARVLAIGDVLQEDAPARLAEEPWLEAALHDFTSDDVLRYLDGARDELSTMSVRGASTPRANARRHGTFRVPLPRHELFPREGYRFSFAARSRPCDYLSTFCVIALDPSPVRSRRGRARSRARGMREVFFLDQTFGLSPAMKRAGLSARRSPGRRSRGRIPRDDELLAAMKRAGCHTLILGVESADDALLARYRKGYTTAGVRTGVERVRRHGLRTVGTFIVGLPEESEASLENTLRFALELELDFMSLNMAVPRFSTPFRGEALARGLTERDALVMDQGGEEAFLETHTLDRERMLALKKSMVRRFYLRPGYLWRRLRGVRTWHELGSQVREGFALLGRNV